nr:solute carrier family 26 protein [Saprospiraceae bacterium]
MVRINFLLKKSAPIFEWLPNYKREYLRGDIIAGLTVGVMLIPQGMAYAMLAGLDPIYGLYASTLPIILYTIFGSSRQLAVGPVAIVSILTAAGIASLNPVGTADYLLYAVTLALLVGIIQLGMGLMRLGFVANFLSHPVISGFTSAAAIIIGLSQLKHLLGIEMAGSDKIQLIVSEFLENMNDIHLITLLIGLGGILVIKGSKKIHKMLPGSLLAVILGIVLVSILSLEGKGVSVLGEVPQGLPTFISPSWEMNKWVKLLPIALTISLVGFVESYAVAKTIQTRRRDYKLDANQELIGLGMANFGAAFLKGFPVTGGFSRTAVNDQSGARTGLASLISALLIVFTLLFLTSFFYYLPTAVLASVIIVSVLGLINLQIPVQLWKKDKSDFYLLMATFIVTLTGGIEVGIIVGFALSIILVIFRASRPHMARLGRIPGTDVFRNLDRFYQLEEHSDTLIMRVDGPLYYANIDYVKKNFDKWVEEKGKKLKNIVLDTHTITSLDSSAAHALEGWILEWQGQQCEVFICGAKGPVRDAMDKWDIVKLVGIDHTFITVDQVIDMIEGKINKEDKKKIDPYTLQSND